MPKTITIQAATRPVPDAHRLVHALLLVARAKAAAAKPAVQEARHAESR